MYQSYLGLTKLPFGLTPDTRFFFSCITYQEALNTLLVAVSNGEGFIKITGEIGNGKTMLCRKFLAALDDNYVVANIFRPCLDSYQLLQVLADEFSIHLPVDADQHQLLKLITNKLLDYAKSNQHVVVCLDEAQSMSLECLETLRLLTNVEIEKYKLLQVVLFGQPELDEYLAHKSMRQFRQRITFQHHLGGLLENELEHYLNHRLKVAGFSGGRIYSNTAIRLMYRVTEGIPRLVNIIAHKSLILVFGEGSKEVLPLHVRQAAIDTPEAKFGWLVGKSNKFTVICQSGGQRSPAVGLINKVLVDLEKRGGIRESLGQAASAYLCAIPGYLRLSKVPMFVQLSLFFLVALTIWSFLNNPFGTTARVHSETDVSRPLEKITGPSIESTPVKLSAHVSHDLLFSDNEAQDQLLPITEPDQSSPIPESFQIVPPAKPARFLAVSGSPELEIEDTFQIAPAGKSNIAESTAGLLSSILDQEITVAMAHPVESAFGKNIIRRINSKQQVDSSFQQAILYMQQGRINEALNKYSQVLQLDASHEKARLAMDSLLLKIGHLDKVEALLREGIHLNSGQVVLVKILSRIQVENGGIEGDLNTVQYSLLHAINQPDYRALIGTLLQRQIRAYG